MLSKYSIRLATKKLFIIESGIIARYVHKGKNNTPSFLIQKYMKQYALVFV